MPTARRITADMSRLRGLATAEWFDPGAGTYQIVSGPPFPNSGGHEFSPPDTNAAGDSDWVLLDASEASSK